jgi:hypothetical protein
MTRPTTADEAWGLFNSRLFNHGKEETMRNSFNIALAELFSPPAPVDRGTVPCECTKVAQDDSCPVGFPSLLCEMCDGKGDVPAVKLDGSELWEIVFGIANDTAAEITDEQYQQIADAINKVFIDPITAAPADEEPVAWLRHGENVPVQNVPFGAMWITDKDDPRGFPVYAMPADQAQPDFCYDPNEWEYTCNWDERDQVHGYGEALTRCEPMEVATLIRGPRKWVADVPITWDEHGDPDETEIKWFDSEEDARAAISYTPPTANGPSNG